MGEDEARAMAEQHLAATLPRRWQHVQAVAAEAARLCDGWNVDQSSIVCAAWLHDIGYAATVADTGYHPLDGARFLRALGWNDVICRLVAHHTDAARQAESRGLADQLRAEFAEVSGIEQDILWTADATTGPTGERFTLDERISEISQRYGADNPVTGQMIASRAALEAAIERVVGSSD